MQFFWNSLLQNQMSKNPVCRTRNLTPEIEHFSSFLEGYNSLKTRVVLSVTLWKIMRVVHKQFFK